MILLLVLALGAAAVASGLSRIAQWLVVADPLQRARGVVVLGGHLPFRAMEAAAIYRDGWAPEVWLTQGLPLAEETALARLGIQVARAGALNRQVLERLGVPPEAIRVLPDGVRNTAEEVQVIARELRRVGGDRAILVTSKPHSRRVRVTWRAVVGEAPRATVRHAAEDPYDPARWWRRTGDALAVSREVFGLLNVWAGFPLKPGSP